MRGNTRSLWIMVTLCALTTITPAALAQENPEKLAEEALGISKLTGPLVVHIGCGDGALTAALGANPRLVVHGLDTDPANVAAARKTITDAGLYGRVSAELWDGRRLPYADEIVNLIVAESLSPELNGETSRVLAPLGMTILRNGDGWELTGRMWPDDIDEWSHYLHDSGNNAVAHDQQIGPPRSLRWTAAPTWSRHHDRIASMTALVSARGRIFYVFDEGSTKSVVLPSKWSLVARDAFNGLLLWKRPIPDWQTRLWPLKSGPAQLPRRLVATADTVFATLGINVPVTALDANTGEIRRTYDTTKGTEEIIFSDGVLYLVVDAALDTEKYTDARRVGQPWWTAPTVSVVAVNAESGAELWRHESPVAPLTLGVDDRGVYFHDGSRVVSLDKATGKPAWQSEPIVMIKKVMSFFAPTLVISDGVVLFAGGEESGLIKSSGGAVKDDTLTALDAATGRKLWSAPHLPSGYSSPEDLFVIGDTVWFGGVSNGALPGKVMGLDLRTGAVRKEYPAADVDTYWFHHRCYRGKATDNYLMVARTGTEFIDPKTGHWDINHWTRGGCLYGIMPANGLLYMPPHDCACYPETKLSGFNALAAKAPRIDRPGSVAGRFERGPAFGAALQDDSAPADWPTYRGDSRRSGSTSASVAANVAETWSADLGAPATATTIASGMVFTATPQTHAVHALNADTGARLWTFTAGGPVDFPPTIHEGAAIFGCADGWIYSVRASDGVLIWRFRAAPGVSRIIDMGALASRWPVHGSVLIQDDILYAVAGRSLFLDGGIRLVRLNAATGELISEEAMDERVPGSEDNIQTFTKRLTLPVGLPDVLSSDGRHVYMRSQVFDMDGKRLQIEPHDAKLGAHAAVQEGDTQHLFSPAGFLDGNWFHRSYWVYGRSFEGGWNSYYLAGRRIPGGKIMAFDSSRVYGYGRKPQFFKWTTPMEFQLFSSPLASIGKADKPEPADSGSIIRVEKSKSLNPTNLPVTVMAWVKPEKPDGVVLARGGGVLGYSLYIKGGKAHFASCAENRRSIVTSDKPIPAGWVHLAGVLTKDARLLVYINGVLAGSGEATKLIPKDPADALQIGGDESSSVGNYEGGLPFTGIIDEVSIHHAALPAETILKHATAADRSGFDHKSAVLSFSFDRGNASDLSGNKNKGTMVGAKSVPGKFANGVRFSGRLPNTAPQTKVAYAWSTEAPILVQGMVATPDALFIAGPEDILDEPAALSKITEDATLELLARQDAALSPDAPGVLRAVAIDDGATLADIKLDTVPVWDGLSAAGGRLYLSGADGTLRCLAPK